MNTAWPVGEYYLQGVTEMASGFKLDENGRFDFFFSYGALDRQGRGTWAVKNGQVVFNSDQPATADFTLLEKSQGDHEEILVMVKDSNPLICRHMFASLQEGAPESWVQANQRGEIVFPPAAFSAVCLLLEFCHERVFRFELNGELANELIFKPEPVIFDYLFKDFILKREGDDLVGQHPLLKPGEYQFRARG
ncbi:MAG: hypothetical protein IPP73_01380 [Chitinophagaceae bacterium]|nr:hypothetical protein [Chitinophagaceae bacterium]